LLGSNLLGTCPSALSALPWGRLYRGEYVEQMTVLGHDEVIGIDSDRLTDLYVELGEAAAEDVICRAMEELAVRLSHAERMYRESDIVSLRKSARSTAAIADQIGLHLLARVARDVTTAIDRADMIALAATLARLLRIGDRSLTAIWDTRDLSV
tara:strand:+ start:465 stop:926 length:462 start_codon:yes stop_codon:yes gene_type:complete